MTIYKYTLKKYAKSHSTWIIALITLIIIVIGMGVLPFEIFPPEKTEDYIKRVLILIPSLTIFLSIFSSIFSGFKSANMFKDEIENGTFLIMISKPIPRHKILIYKWLALQTFLLIYSLFTAFSEVITILIFDNGDQFTSNTLFFGISTLKEKAFVIFGFTTLILYIMSLTFSSITILLSTRLSVSSSIGIAIAISVVIPITRLVYVFTSKDEIQKVINKNPLQEINPFENIDPQKQKQYSNLLSIYKADIARSPQYVQDFVKFLDFEKTKENYQTSLNKLSKDPKSIYEIGYLTGEIDSYKNLWLLDTNFQISKLSSLVYDEIIPRQFQNSSILRFSRSNYFGRYDEAINKNLLQSKSGDPILEKLNEFIERSWQITKNIRANFLSLWIALFWLARKDIDKSLKANKNTNSYKTFYDAYQNFMNVATINDKNGTSPRNQKVFDFKFSNFNFYKHFARIIGTIRESGEQTNLKGVQEVVALYKFVSIFSKNPFLMSQLIEIQNKEIQNFLTYLSQWLARIIMPMDNYYSYNIKQGLDENSIPSENYDSQVLAKAMGIKIDLNKNENSRSQVKFIDTNNKTKKYNFTKLYNYQLVLNNRTYAQDYFGIYLLLKNNVKFGRFKTKEYVSKYTILIIFVSVSFALIPLSYLSIRRKDFK